MATKKTADAKKERIYGIRLTAKQYKTLRTIEKKEKIRLAVVIRHWLETRWVK